MWRRGRRWRRNSELKLHKPSTSKSRKPNEIRHLRVFRECLSCIHAVRHVCRLRVGTASGRRSGRDIGGDCRASKGRGNRRSRWSTPARQVRPVACLIHPDLAPRDAPRTIGPRLDRTRSAGSDEPGGTAIRPGDLCRGPSSSSRAAQAAGGEREKNGGMHAPPPAGRCMRRPSSHDWMAASAFWGGRHTRSRSSPQRTSAGAGRIVSMSPCAQTRGPSLSQLSWPRARTLRLPSGTVPGQASRPWT